MTKKLTSEDMDTSPITIDELLIADDMMSVVREEVTAIRHKGQADRDERDLVKLEKLAKVYATLMASHRENIKYGVFGNLGAEDFEDAVEGGESAAGREDPGDEPA